MIIPSTLTPVSPSAPHRYWDTPFFVELLLLAMAAPALYFPGRFGLGAIVVAIGLLVLGWVWRRWMVGVWYQRTPADWPLFFLFLVMLPVSVWVAPGPLQAEYSIPRALTLIWNFALFWVVVSHGSRRRELRHMCAVGFALIGGLIAGVSLFGTNWPENKLFGLTSFLDQMPQFFVGVFAGAESGFHPNQLGGTLLYALPFLTALVAYTLYRRDWKTGLPGGMLLGLIGFVFLAAQSRAALLGFAICLPVMGLLNLRRGRWILSGGVVVAGVTSMFVTPNALLQVLDRNPFLESIMGFIRLTGRFDIWQRALAGIADFSWTGMGLGVFRELVHIRYPFSTNYSTKDIGHAHNFFLQTALDFGLPGLLCLLAICMIAVVFLVDRVARAKEGNELRIWATGLLGSLLASSLYGLSDAVSMGSKTNLVFWFLLALIFSLPPTFPETSGVPEACAE